MKDSLNIPLAKGAIIVMPTDTIYGLACSAKDEEAVKRLYTLKTRENKPGTIIASDIEQLVALGIKRRYLKAVEHLWPNPISVVMPSEPSLSYLDLGVGTIAVRVVANSALRQVLEDSGPMLTSSANLPGEKPAENIAEAKKYFADGVDKYIDGGDLSGRKPSTIIRVIDDAVEVLRQGAVKVNEKGEIKDAAK